MADEIKSWLQDDTTYKELVTSDDLGYKYDAVYSGSVDIKRAAINFGSILLKFDCKPFKKQRHDNIITLTKPTTYMNNGLKTNPILKIFGNGDITVKINNQNLVLKNITDYIIVDSNMVNAYKVNQSKNEIINQNQNMYSDFPVIEQGNNDISWSGKVDKIELNISELKY